MSSRRYYSLSRLLDNWLAAVAVIVVIAAVVASASAAEAITESSAAEQKNEDDYDPETPGVISTEHLYPFLRAKCIFT